MPTGRLEKLLFSEMQLMCGYGGSVPNALVRQYGVSRETVYTYLRTDV